MNIKISKSDFIRLYTNRLSEVIIGSKLYGVDDEDSDTDILVFVEFPRSWNLEGYPNYHQSHYDNIKNNTQYIFTDTAQFWMNQRSGDSTINSDVILFSDYIDTSLYTDKYKLALCRTQKVIKAYLGFAKRDIKMINDKRKKNKVFHATRSLYCADRLLDNELPTLKDIQDYSVMKNPYTVEELKDWEASLRLELRRLFDAKELKKYHVPRVPDTLYQQLLDANNITEFKYD